MSATVDCPTYVSPRPTRHCQSIYRTPRSRRKSIRTVGDVPISHSKSCSNKKKKKASICCICLESINLSDIASLDCCSHLFHKECIESWSGIENACPLCKNRFNTIYDVCNNKQISVIQRDQTPAYHIELGNIIWLDCVCIMCGSDDNEELLLLCDGCDAAQHTYCVGLGDIVPAGDYYCDSCNDKFGDLLELGLKPQSIFIDNNNNNNNGSNIESIINYNHNHNNNNNNNSSNDNTSDEEYIPSPQRRQQRRRRTTTTTTTTTRSRSNGGRRKRKRGRGRRRGRGRGIGMSMDTTDEEYIPDDNDFDNITMRRRATRRSQRIRDIQQRASTPDEIDLEEEDDNVNNERRARSASPVCRRRGKSNNINNSSTLSGLPTSTLNKNKNGYNGCNGSRTQRMMVIDQNNKKHLLGFKRNSNRCNKPRFNSLANLFDHTPKYKHSHRYKRNCGYIEISDDNNTKTFDSDSNSINHRSVMSISSVSTKSILSQQSISSDNSSIEIIEKDISDEDEESEENEEDEEDEEDEEEDDDDEVFNCHIKTTRHRECILTRSKMREKLKKAKSKKRDMTRKSSLTSLSVVNEYEILSTKNNENIEDRLDTDNNDEPTESEYTPSDYISSDNQSELSDINDYQRRYKKKIKKSERKRYREPMKLRRSQRLRHQKEINDDDDDDDDDEEEEDDDMMEGVIIENMNKHKNNRKRSLHEIEGIESMNMNTNNRKRVKYNHSTTRKYSSLSQL